MGAPKPGHGQCRKRKLKGAHTSHNLVEKRYRANLNQKILDLKAAVPSLQFSGSSSREKSQDLEGNQDTQKIHKATILDKAIEYIHELETRNRLLEKNILFMEHHIESNKHEKQVHLAQGGADEQNSNVEEEQTVSVLAAHPINGMIQVPTEFQKLHSHHSGSLYIKSTLCDHDLVYGKYDQQNNSALRNLHVGSLAL